MLKTLIALSLLLLGSATALGDTFALVNGHYVSGNPPGTCAITSTVGIGQIIVAMQEGGGTGTSVTDSVNTGSYSVLYSVSSVAQRIFWIVTNSATGPATLTLSGSSGSTGFQCFAVTGFVGTPTADTAIQNRATGTGTSLTISATSNFNNEVLLMNAYNATSQSITVSGWAPTSTSGDLAFYAFETTAGTANNFSGMITNSVAWYLQLAGIYDSYRPPAFVISNGHALMSNGKPVVN